MDGINDLTKKQAMDKVLPKLEDYLKEKSLKNKLLNLLHKRPKHEKNLLRKYLFKWYAKVNKVPKQESKEEPKIKDEENPDDKINEFRKKI